MISARTSVACAVLFWAGIGSTRAAETTTDLPAALQTAASVKNEVPASITVRFPDVRKLTGKTHESIYAHTIDMLQTSIFNSAVHARPFQGGIPGVQARYRKTVSGRYLVITFKTPRKFRTLGGKLSAFEVVVGLNRSDYADSLFTIDVEGRIIEHSKYSGGKGIELLKTIKKAINDD